MTGDQPLRGREEPAADPLSAAPYLAGSGDTADAGDPACWACLVCDECGAVISEGHRASCSHAVRPAAPPVVSG